MMNYLKRQWRIFKARRALQQKLKELPPHQRKMADAMLLRLTAGTPQEQAQALRSEMWRLQGQWGKVMVKCQQALDRNKP